MIAASRALEGSVIDENFDDNPSSDSNCSSDAGSGRISDTGGDVQFFNEAGSGSNFEED
jgi:hypothetical protein